jgi:uncharacterized protein YrrD
MQFKEGAKVLTSAGEQVGTIDRVVIDPGTKEVTHLVVEKGFLFTDDKVLPISLVGPAKEDEVILRKDEGFLEKLPDYKETHYVPVEQDQDQDLPPTKTTASLAPPLYQYPPSGSWWEETGHAESAKPRLVPMTETNIPDGAVALEDGADVIGSDGEKIGEIERIITDPVENRATHILIAEGLLLKAKKLIPTGWIKHILEDEVHLYVKSDFVDGLPNYQLQD